MAMPRVDETEKLDAPVLDPERLEASLRQVHRVNRWFGGVRSLHLHLRDHRERRDLRVLDVGTGDGGVLAGLVRWAGRGGGRWRGVGVDHHAQIAELAARKSGGAPRGDGNRAASVEVVRGDALALPFPDRAFHLVLCTLTLHHFAREGALAVLREMGRVSRELVLVSDLHRHPVNYVLARLLSVTLWAADPITRHDGPLSVRRSFTPRELEELGREAGLWGVEVHRHPIYRLVLTARPGEPPS